MALKIQILFVGLVVGQMVCFGQDKLNAHTKRMWGASYHITVMGDNKITRLEGLLVSQGREHLFGGLVLVRQVGKTQLEIKGHLSKLGEFEPNVSLDVSDREDGSWKAIDQPCLIR